MSDPPKSTPFSFNQQATSGNTSNIFGQPSTSTPTTTGSLFGQSSATPASSNPSPFSALNTTSGPPLFGAFGSGAATGSNLFGGGDKSSPGGFNFGNPGSNNLSKGFDTDKAGLATNPPPSSNVPSLVFTTLSTPNKPSEAAAPSQTQTTGLFGGAKSTGEGGLFGSGGTIAGSSGHAETSTPTSKPSTGFAFGTSTTPAGPPPTDSIGTGANSGSIFGLNKSQETKGNIFATANTTQPANTFSSFGMATNPGNIFGPKPTESTAPGSTPQTTSSILNKSATDTTSNIFGKLGATSQPGTGTLGKPKDGELNGLAGTRTSSNTTNVGLQSQTATTKPASMFSDASMQQLGGGQNTQVSNPSLAPTAASNPFSSLGSKSDATATSSPAVGTNNFTNSNVNTPKVAVPKNKIAVTSGTSGTSASSTLAPTSSVLGGATSSTAPPTTLQPTAPAATASTSNNAGGTNATLGASTAGPAPPAQSRLKNKSMDEIITRWASDLAKHQKDFQRLADKVAVWDGMLVENSEKIQRLYGSTLEAERATTEVERQLTAVENDQAELAGWLDHYEKEVNQMMSNNVSPGDSQGPDQERERTYKLADKLSIRLDEMGKDLTGMIMEINDATSKLGKNGKADDPLTHVVRVLNSHLAQLQQIDQGAAALQAKVAAAQIASQSIGSSNGLVGPSSDAADGFYRSYMGRR
ncbi:FG-nucleoporin nsp1 [Pseudocyphellaria aurata]|nr:FG-nucleoporin nsp1 [Pseudocyphellaria aurata]